MGDPRKPRKSYRRPRRIWNSDQLSSELYIIGSYGLRTRGLWKAPTRVQIIGISKDALRLTLEDRQEKETHLLSFLIG